MKRRIFFSAIALALLFMVSCTKKDNVISSQEANIQKSIVTAPLMK